MSYEGYTEYMCSMGHYWAKDVYEELAFGHNECPYCLLQPTHAHSVDLTNGVDADQPSTFPAEKLCVGGNIYQVPKESVWVKIGSHQV